MRETWVELHRTTFITWNKNLVPSLESIKFYGTGFTGSWDQGYYYWKSLMCTFNHFAPTDPTNMYKMVPYFVAHSFPRLFDIDLALHTAGWPKINLHQCQLLAKYIIKIHLHDCVLIYTAYTRNNTNWDDTTACSIWIEDDLKNSSTFLLFALYIYRLWKNLTHIRNPFLKLRQVIRYTCKHL